MTVDPTSSRSALNYACLAEVSLHATAPNFGVNPPVQFKQSNSIFRLFIRGYLPCAQLARQLDFWVTSRIDRQGNCRYAVLY